MSTETPLPSKETLVGIAYAPIETLHPNPWNPNKMNERVYEAERESIRTYGFIDPVTVRPHPTFIGEWEIIDGEHRVRVAGEEGYTELPYISLPLDDLAARKLTVVLNETRGEAELVPLSQLLVSLKDGYDTMDELLNALPYETRQLEDLLKIGAQDWDNFQQEDGQAVEDFLRQASQNKYTVFLAFDKGQKEQYTTFTEMLAREADGEFTVEKAVIDALASACQAL